jgi:C-terminal processing protease CtpA/Prc
MNVGAGLPLADVSGVIGADLLRHAFILLDESGQTASLVVRGGASVAQDYDRSGLWLIDRNRSIVVRSVTRGSAADFAGLSEGDSILYVDGKAVGPDDLDSVRLQLAQTSAHSVSLSYRRGRSARRIVLVLRSLL